MTNPGVCFAKMHGIGNDFVVVDATRQKPPPAFWRRQNLARLANRKTGVGCDQILALCPPPAAGGGGKKADFAYRVFNADGGEVGQCGNGARCVYAFARAKKLTRKRAIVLQTATTRIVAQAAGGGEVRAAMPPPVFEPSIKQGGRVFWRLHLGNPHAVWLDPAARNLSDGQIVAAAAAVARRFANGVNVGFGARRKNGGIDLRVVERGSGLTSACGSGALAAAVAGIRQGLCRNPTRVFMRGGELLCGQEANGDIFLQGKVAFVYEGVLLCQP